MIKQPIIKKIIFCINFLIIRVVNLGLKNQTTYNLEWRKQHYYSRLRPTCRSSGWLVARFLRPNQPNSCLQLNEDSFKYPIQQLHNRYAHAKKTVSNVVVDAIYRTLIISSFDCSYHSDSVACSLMLTQ